MFFNEFLPTPIEHHYTFFARYCHPFFIVALAGGIRYLLPEIIPDFPEFYTSAMYVWWFLPIWITFLIFERAFTGKFTFWEVVKVLWKVSLFSTLTVLTLLFLTKLSIFVSRTFIVLIGVISVIVFHVLRLTMKRWLIKAGLLTCNVLIVGVTLLMLLLIPLAAISALIMATSRGGRCFTNSIELVKREAVVLQIQDDLH